MKVTDEMVDAVHRAINGVCPEYCLKGHVRAGLTAALDDVPEPSVVDTLRNLLATQRQRTEAAEAKLVKVREWAEQYAGDIFHGQHADLLDILDGE